LSGPEKSHPDAARSEVFPCSRQRREIRAAPLEDDGRQSYCRRSLSGVRYDIFQNWLARRTWAESRFGRDFDLAGEDTFDVARRDAKYPASAAEADTLWERLLAAWLISERLEGRTPEDALAAARRRLDRLDHGLGTVDAETIEESFLNALLELRDPHSGYHSWDSMLDLEVDLAGSFVGIGAEIKRVNGQTLIAHLTPGGAAEAGAGMQPGDQLRSVMRRFNEPG
jgi:carboxyl-terminal processing protease